MFWISVEVWRFMSISTLVLFSVPDSRKEEDAGHEESVSLLLSSHELYIYFFFFSGRKEITGGSS